MFNKVLVAEDLGSINHSVVHTLREQLQIAVIEHALYCDDTYLKVLKSIKDKAPFDLLITDLSFTKDHRFQKIQNGKDLISKVREQIPEIKILVYSIENRSNVIKSLFTDYEINGYICKGRNGLKELEQAVLEIQNGIEYISPELKRTLKSDVFELQDYDVQLLEKLSLGDSQEEISIQFKENRVSPNSISTIEKRLNKLKIEFKAKNTVQLIAIVKDLGII
ncbi:response regulator [Nonlabens marinus]|uniref:Uncharacterized protein n=1 Tax=Nonlabens marinus S1-08 TaxID=1454201 RepID=W8VQY6_9FLAO|nr:response regulator transcription factor [Nonlabens marinus]BAO55974.1 hypothetical protein NMS_1965 [Nonlabens marinus S1-08]